LTAGEEAPDGSTVVLERPSRPELVYVWLAGVAGGFCGWALVDDCEVMTLGTAVAGGLFLLTPLFLVVYSVVWAWPLAAAGDRTAVKGLVAFAAMVQALAGWSWVGAHTITLTTFAMRLLFLFNPVVFVICAVSAAWVHHRRKQFLSSAPGRVRPT
jgi:hypothetical protein